MTRSRIRLAIASSLVVVATGGLLGYLVVDGARPPAAEAPAAPQVVERLHEEGLVMDLEVRDSMISHANRFQAGEMTREEAAQRLLAWMKEWEANNPERARRARELFAQQQQIAQGPPPAPNVPTVAAR